MKIPENSYFERIGMVRMVRMVRSLADRTFQLWPGRELQGRAADEVGLPGGRRAEVLVPEGDRPRVVVAEACPVLAAARGVLGGLLQEAGIAGILIETIVTQAANQC